MKNKNKLKRCLDYLKSNKEEIIQNYNNILPSNKEKIILNYLKTLKTKLKEKYNIEFCEFFIDEYGNKKNLCSSIIQIFFPFDKGNNYKEIYSLIKNYFTYEIFLKKKIETLLLPDVSLVFDWKIADCADLSSIVVSSLRTKNYEAYVVCGEAPFYICSKNDKKLFCKFNLKEFEQSKEKNEDMTEIKEKKKKYKKILKVNQSPLRNIEFEEKQIISENDFYVHMWILIKKSLDLKKDIFIEMSSGREYDIDNCPYKSIFYLWNEKNIYININKTENMKILVSEIKNKEYFIPAFYEEIKNKNLNPIVENKFYRIRKDRFLLKYPLGCNITFYENCKKDEYGDFLQHDGLIEMHTHYENKYYTSVDYTCSFYKYRRDKKTAKIYLPQKFKVIEYYDDYSHQFLKKLEQKIGFYSYFKFYSNRSDGLINYLEIKNYKLMEYFVNRNDNVIYRSMKLSENIKTNYKLQSFEGNEYYVTKITVKYKNKNMNNAIHKKVFLIPENKIIIVFYNNNNKISNICEVYEKCTKYNEDKEENEEILTYRKNFIYKHFINYKDSVKSDVLYLLKEEHDFFEDMIHIYNNVICSIMKERKEIKRVEDDYQYMSNNITNINEIIYHDNNKIHFLNKNLLDDNINIYKFYQNYPWYSYLEVSMENTFFSSKKNMLKTENSRSEIAYVASKKRNKSNHKDTHEEVNEKIKLFFCIFHFNIYVNFLILK
ncbi:conserved Plasmodium protein, unknown function [Plasmodium relictum]|uniref:Dynein regulatory complex subunit 7 MORN domain-containing protein n=1 Tax=Plasmodium relictum TaxID=85471 RepID=A0A1J1HB49_PLARL|nr:conserved Plasmodium protein, unknown function [Plasmodium relictum]CRH02721.1 conserved Plasmodium protein, unknown function [Plasmodium relictum]